MVALGAPHASRRSSHAVFCRTGRIFEETAICVIDETGGVVKESRATSDPHTLSDALQNIGYPLERIGLEACSLAAWLYEGLTAQGTAGDLHRDADRQCDDEDDAEQD